MINKTSFNKKVFLNFLTVFVLFTIAISGFQYNREKQHKTQELDNILQTYTDFANHYIQKERLAEENDLSRLNSLIKLLPRNDIRITIIDLDGTVMFDSFHPNHKQMENHRSRPEVEEAIISKRGTNKRISGSTNQDFYYYAKRYDNHIVRAAVLYTINVKEFLKVESLFMFVILFIFIITVMLLFWVSDKIGKSILQLKDFAIKAAANENIETSVTFPANELGTIGNQIVNIYKNLRKSNIEINREKEKLIYHLQMSQDGIGIFAANNEKILVNNNFVQYLYIISDSPTINAEQFNKIDLLRPVSDFISQHLDNDKTLTDKTLPMKSISIEKNKRYFDINCIIFHDKSYEIIISDITKDERRKRLKQEMTSNIAHELRTPVSSIKGYLETILCSKDLSCEKLKYFVEKASLQTERLSELIRDMSILTKIEEASDLFEIDEVNIASVIDDVIENLHSGILAKNADIEINVNKNRKIKGNRSLIYSIFQNLLENSLKYGKQSINIIISEYRCDDDYVYFSFADNGIGIEEEHQVHVFERFYRVDQGRARNNGGTGLGLAIVKNAVQLHKGKIIVKTRKGGGTEFLFYLAIK